jgi:hypothetical protein
VLCLIRSVSAAPLRVRGPAARDGGTAEGCAHTSSQIGGTWGWSPDDSRIAKRFPGALVALDTYPRRTFDRQHRMAAKKNIPARWAWACDDPRSLQGLGLRVVESTTITRPPRALRAQLPPLYRYLLPLTDPLLGKALKITLFQARS